MTNLPCYTARICVKYEVGRSLVSCLNKRKHVFSWQAYAPFAPRTHTITYQNHTCESLMSYVMRNRFSFPLPHMLGLLGHVIFKLCHINPLANVLSKILKSETSFFAVHSWLMSIWQKQVGLLPWCASCWRYRMQWTRDVYTFFVLLVSFDVGDDTIVLYLVHGVLSGIATLL